MNFLSIFSTSPFALPSHELQRISTLFLVFSSALKASLATPTHPLLSSRVLDHTLKALVRVLREEGDSDKDVSVSETTTMMMMSDDVKLCHIYHPFS